MTDLTPSTDGTEARYRALRALPLDAPGALPELVRNLSDESWRVRKAAVDRLVQIRPVEAAVAALVDVLDRPGDVPARNAAAEALARFGFAAIPALATLLRHENADARKFAADILGIVGHADGVEPLARALEDPDHNVRASAAEALGKIGGPRAALALERALALPDHLLRVSVLDGLWRIGAVPATSLLESLARDRYLRRPIYRLLGRSRDPRALSVVVGGLSDPGRSTREAALAAIAEQARSANGFFWGRLVIAVRRSGTSGEALTKLATEALAREDAVVGEGALLVLGAHGREADARVLVEAGAQPRYHEVSRAALAGMGTDAVAPLIAALPQLSPAALLTAAEFLGPESGAELEPHLLAVLEVATPDLLPDLLEILGEVGTLAAVRPIARWSRVDEFPEEVMASLETLARRKPEEVLALARAEWKNQPSAVFGMLLGAGGGEAEVPTLVAALRHADPSMRVAAAAALGHLGVPSALDPLRSGLTDEAEEVRAACLRALGRLAAPQLTDVLRLALRDPAPAVRETAARVAAEASLAELAPDLRALLEGPSGSTAIAALEALQRLDRLDAPTLERASEHVHVEVCARSLALSAGGAEGMGLVRVRLTHPRWEIRRAAARVAGAAAGADDLRLIEQLLEKESDPLVKEALQDAATAAAARVRG